MAAVQMAGSLLLAAQRGDSAGLQRELLADSSSSLVEDARDETHQMCALCWAAVSDELECVRLLLEDGRASLHSRSAHGMSVLHHAASSASIRTLRLLLEQSVSNAVTNAVNEWDETPVHLAAASGHKTSIECRVAAGADLKLQDRWGRTPAMVAEALECLGGNGYVEDSGLPLLFRESPLNSVWEGSGNVNALDVLRALSREPDVLDAWIREVGAGRGADPRLDRAVEQTLGMLGDGTAAEAGARRLAGAMATCLQGALLVQHAPAEVADAFCASRLGAGASGVFGTLPVGDLQAIVQRATPVLS